MKTYRHLPTGKLYPVHGCHCSFEPNEARKRMKYFIRGDGWKTSALSKWEAVEIPDLSEHHTLAQFREYAAQYGRTCAQEFLPTCDYMKERQAALLLDPSYPDDETQEWVALTFKLDARDCCTSLPAVFGHYSFDILRFEDHMAKTFGYPQLQDGSMRDFMVARWGKETADRFERVFLSRVTNVVATS